MLLYNNIHGNVNFVIETSSWGHFKVNFIRIKDLIGTVPLNWLFLLQGDIIKIDNNHSSTLDKTLILLQSFN